MRWAASTPRGYTAAATTGAEGADSARTRRARTDRERQAECTAASRHIALHLEHFFLLLRDPRELAGLLCHDFEHWLRASPEARALGREVHGF